MSNIIIQVKGLVKEFEEGRIIALRGVELEVNHGEIVAIMGPSGCGKSTLLSIIGALDRPTSGEVFFNGQALGAIRDLDRFRSRTIGFIFQAFYLLPTLTAIENVQVPMFETIFSPIGRRRKAEELLRLVDLGDRLNQLPSKLSGGERQRVAIARSLANDPEVVLADEPTGNLDSKTSEGIISLLKRINEERRATIIIVTHDQLVAGCANRILKMLDGRIVS